jgi:hypothetical protein
MLTESADIRTELRRDLKRDILTSLKCGAGEGW